MRKIFLLIIISLFVIATTGCEKGKDISADKAKVPFSIENRITELVEGATDDKRIQQEMREELRFFIDQGYSNIGWVSIAYDPILNDFEYRFEGDISMSRFKLQQDMDRNQESLYEKDTIKINHSAISTKYQKGKYGIYFEDSEAPEEIIKIRNSLYNFFEQLSERVINKEDVMPTNCLKECQNLVYKMYPISESEVFRGYQFVLVDLIINKKTENMMYLSFQHLDFYELPHELLVDAQEVRVEFIKQGEEWIMYSIKLYEPYERFIMAGKHYYPKDSILLNP